MPLVYARTVIKRPPASIRLRSATYSASLPTRIRRGGGVPSDYLHPLVGLHAPRAAALDQFRLENGEGASNCSQVAGPGLSLEAMPECPAHGEYRGRYDEEIGYTVSCSVAEHDRYGAKY